MPSWIPWGSGFCYLKGPPPPLSGVTRNSLRALFFNIFLISSWGSFFFRFWCPRPPKRRPRWPKRRPRWAKMLEKSTQIGTQIGPFWYQVGDPMLGPVFDRKMIENRVSESYKSIKNAQRGVIFLTFCIFNVRSMWNRFFLLLGSIFKRFWDPFSDLKLLLGTLLENVVASWSCLGENWRQDAPQDRQDEFFTEFQWIFGPHMGGTNVWVLEHFVGLGASCGQDGPRTPQERFQDRF